MPRARQTYTDEWQTAAALDDEGGGCFIDFVLPPLAVLFVGGLLAIFALSTNVQAQATQITAAPAISKMEPINSLTNLTETSTSPAVGSALLAQDSSAAASHISPVFRPEVQHWANSISRWAAGAGLDPNLAAVVMQIESCGDPRATSRSGAIGLFQVMPFHFSRTDEPYDPDTNASRGLAYLARSLTAAGGSPRLALAGYNGGIGVITRSEWAWSGQTQRYVYYGSPIYEDARSGFASSPMLDEWYNKYGISLCRQASERLGMQ